MDTAVDMNRTNFVDCSQVAAALPRIIDGLVVADLDTRRHVDGCLRCQAELARHRQRLRSLHGVSSGDLATAQMRQPGSFDQPGASTPSSLLSRILTALGRAGRAESISALMRGGRRALDSDDTAFATAAAGSYGLITSSEAAAQELLVTFAQDERHMEFFRRIGRTPIVGPPEALALLYRNLAYSTRLQAAVLELEQLMSCVTVREQELQHFLESFPEMITGFDYIEAIPQVVLETREGKLIPDFILRPIAHNLCDVLEIKRPNVKLLTLKDGRPQLTRAVASAISQLKFYSEAITDPEVRDTVATQYGIELYRPRLELLVGRSEGLDRRQLYHAKDPGVDIQTWDDVLRRAKARFM